MGSRVEGSDLPGRAGLRAEMREPGGLHGEQRHPVRVEVVWVAGQLADGVMGDHDVGTELPQLRNQLGDDFVQGSVAQARAPRCRRVVAGVAVPEHPRSASTEDRQRLSQLGRPVRIRSPRGSDDPSPCTPGGMLGQNTARKETFVIRVCEHAEQ